MADPEAFRTVVQAAFPREALAAYPAEGPMARQEEPWAALVVPVVGCSPAEDLMVARLVVEADCSLRFHPAVAEAVVSCRSWLTPVL